MLFAPGALLVQTVISRQRTAARGFVRLHVGGLAETVGYRHGTFAGAFILRHWPRWLTTVMAIALHSRAYVHRPLAIEAGNRDLGAFFNLSTRDLSAMVDEPAVQQTQCR